MENCIKNRYYWPLMAVLFLLATSTSAASLNNHPPEQSPSQLEAYTAELELTYNGKLQSRPSAKLESLGDDRFRYTLKARGEKGLAWLARAQDTEIGEFNWNQGKPQALIFTRKLKYLGKKEHWHAAFNWQSMQVSIRHNDDTFDLKLEPGTLDPVTFLFSMQDAVAKGETEFSYPFLDKDEIETKHYKFSGKEDLQTVFGCLPTIKIERIYKKPGKFQHHWLAPQLNHIVVRTDTGKTNKRTISLTLKKLHIQGQTVAVKDRCQQGTGRP
ncbi:MAG: DUF3108 domain-containing protein [Xanthomonadales bacterium]|nr:DUF3108 domain-containing protein [Xanthomonadales bacterium]